MQVAFKTASNEDLRGEFNEKSRSKQLIVVCHGYKSSGRAPTVIALTNGLNGKGYSTFAFDFPKGSDVDIQKQVSDIADIIEHFDSYDDFILLAASFGALSATIAAIKLPKIRELITINGFFGSGKLGKEHRGTFRKFRLASMVVPRYRKIWKFYKEELQPAKLTIPVLVIHSKVDIVVPIEQSQHFFKQISGPKEFEMLQTATHGLSSSDDVTIVVETIDIWLKKSKS
jgi:pimeloyl-ACP methyl ester carboxylesterase